MTFFLDTVSIDYLTLTTFNPSDYAFSASALSVEFSGSLEKSRRMQYEGLLYKTESSGSLFFGSGIIGDKEHYIITASGMLSHKVATICKENRFSDMSRDDQWNCTRVDVQITTPHQKLNAYELKTAFDGGEWPKGVKRSTTLISGKTDTLYVGSRRSAVMFRIYQKTDSDVRLELELKRHASRQCWQWIMNNDAIKDDSSLTHELVKLLLHEVRQLPTVSYLKPFVMKLHSPAAIDVTTGERVKEDSKKLAWLKTLVPTFIKMVNDDDIGDNVQDIFMFILENRTPDDIDKPPPDEVEF